MEKVRVSAELQLTKIVLGFMRIKSWNYTKKELLAYIEQSIDLGVTTFDHADIYGGFECEEIFGDALSLKPELRSKMQLITKCGIVFNSPKRPQYNIKAYDTSKKHIISSVENSLSNFHTDYIDLLLIHRPNPFVNPEEIAYAFQTLSNQGKVKAFGVSNFTPSQFNMLASYVNVPLVTNQVLLSLFNTDCLTNGTIDHAFEKRIPLMAYSPVAKGALHTNSNEKAIRIKEAIEKLAVEIDCNEADQLLYSWLLAHPVNIMPIVGSGKLKRLKLAVNALNIKLTSEQWFELYKASTGIDVP